MRRETMALVEAVRELSVELSPTTENPNGIRILCPRGEFPQRLSHVQRALEEFDAAVGSASEAVEITQPPLDGVMLKMALDAVFRWMRSQGMDISEPHSAVAAILRTNKQAKSGPVLKPIPRFALEKRVKGKKPRPLLKLTPGEGEKVTLDSLRQKNLQANSVLTTLGYAALT